LLKVPGIILIFKTFFKDLKYLKPIIIILRGILLLNYENFIKEIVTRYYIGLLEYDGYYLVQFGLNKERYIPNTPGLLIRYR